MEVGDEQIFINAKSESDTKEWFEELVQRSEVDQTNTKKRNRML
jgi:hypothetical protein